MRDLVDSYSGTNRDPHRHVAAMPMQVCLARVSPDDSIPFKETLEDAYKHNLKDYSGGVAQMSFNTALLAVPQWKGVREKLGPPSAESFQEDVFAWMDTSQARVPSEPSFGRRESCASVQWHLCERDTFRVPGAPQAVQTSLMKMLKEYNMDDQRKSL